jgi:DNA-binding CsgD family transcriptional regulator/membrane protein implicated in regulation of membrane protease activity
MSWVLWLLVALVTLVGELFTLGLYLAPFALSALITAALATVVPFPVQVLGFVGLSLLLLLVVRPIMLRLFPTLGAGAEEPQIGPSERIGTVVDRIERGRGQIRVGMGEFWSARSIEPNLALARGQQVEIVGMDGLTALVRPTTQRLEPSAAPAETFGLSAREIEVLQLVALGMSNAEIAERLFLSPRTVHHHVSHILTKMGVDNRVEAVRLGYDCGLVRPGERQ